MQCRFCKKDPKTFMLVPNIKNQKPKDDLFCCIPCGRKEGIYCDKHERPHTGFLDNKTTACLFCVEEEVQANRNLGEETYTRIIAAISEEELDDLNDLAKESSAVTGDPEALSVLRFVVSMAHRLKLSRDEILDLIVERHSMEQVLPLYG